MGTSTDTADLDGIAKRLSPVGRRTLRDLDTNGPSSGLQSSMRDALIGRGLISAQVVDLASDDAQTTVNYEISELGRKLLAHLDR